MLPNTDMAILGAGFHGHVQEIDRSGFQPEWLESNVSRLVMSAMLTLSRTGKTINALNIMALCPTISSDNWKPIFELGRNGYGDVDWRNAVTAARDSYVGREMQKSIDAVEKELHQGNIAPSRLLPKFAYQLTSLIETGRPHDADPMSLYQKSTPQIVWKSFIPEFNYLLGGGYRNGMLVIYAGVSGHGKSTTLITHVVDCVMQGIRTVVIVNELTPEMFFKRVLRGVTGLSEREVETRKGDTPIRQEILDQWLAYLQPILRVYDSDMYSPEKMKAAVSWDDAEILIVDYLRGTSVDRQSLKDPAGDMAYALLDLYRDRRIPIITAGQVSDTNAKTFLKNDNAPPAIIYGSARTQQASTVYIGTKRDTFRKKTQYYHSWKNTFTGVMDLEARVPFDVESYIYAIPLPPPERRGVKNI